MINFIVYNNAGEILKSGVCSKCDMENQIDNEGEYVIEGIARFSEDFIDKGIIKKRPYMDCSWDRFSVTVPKNSVVVVDGDVVGECLDGTVDIVFNGEDKYLLTIKKFPYRDFCMEVSSEGIVEI